MPTLFVAGDPLAGPPAPPEPAGIKFTQHLMPDGRTVPQWLSYPPEIDRALWALTEKRAEALIAQGYSLHMELMPDFRTVSFTVESPDDEGDFAHQLVANGPGVPQAVVDLIGDAHQRALGDG